MHFDIEEYVTERLTLAKPSASGSEGQEYTAECPSCGKSSKFYVNIASGRFVCFGCDFRGRSIVWLVSEVEGISTSEARAFIFRRSVKLRRAETTTTLLDRIAALRPQALDLDDLEESDLEDFPPPPEFRPVWNGKRWSLPEFLKRRGIKSKTARAWGMGYCAKGKYGQRLIIPFECPNGRSYTARDMTEEGLTWADGSPQPKYLNPKGADHKRLFIGWNMAPLTGDIVLCEGPLDAVRLWQHGIPALALGGKVLHDEQRDMLVGNLSEDQAIIIMMDPEEALAPEEMAPKLAVHFKSLYIAKLPEGIDPGESTREQANNAVDRARKWTGGRGGLLAARLAKSRKTMSSRWE